MIDEIVMRVDAYYDQKVKDEYPTVRIANIVCGAEDGLADMRTFIDGMNSSRDALVALVQALESTDIVDTFTRGTDDVMAACIHAVLPGITDTQTSAMMDAIYPISQAEE